MCGFINSDKTDNEGIVRAMKGTETERCEDAMAKESEGLLLILRWRKGQRGCQIQRGRLVFKIINYLINYHNFYFVQNGYTKVFLIAVIYITARSQQGGGNTSQVGVCPPLVTIQLDRCLAE